MNNKTDKRLKVITDLAHKCFEQLCVRLASVYDRWLKVEERHLETGIELTAEQVAKIEKYNPCFKERHVESSRPGELLCQDRRTWISG